MADDAQNATDSQYRRRIRAWCLYDWANSAFATTIMAAMFPLFYHELAKGAGLSDDQATAYWGYTASIALAIIAPLAPILGAVADHRGSKKRFLAAFIGLGTLATACFVFLGPGAWLLASVLFILGNIGFAGGNAFYDSLLPHVARPGDIDRVSTAGYALGYIGGGVLLVVNLAWYMKWEWFGWPSAGFALKASFLSVAIWWVLFSIPLFRRVAEPPSGRAANEGHGSIRGAFRSLADTARNLRRRRQALLFLIAFLIYNDGISTIFRMAVSYGLLIKLTRGHMIAALIITQFVGVPAAFAFGYLARWITAKWAVMVGLVIYTGICVGAYFMQTDAHFYVLAVAVGLTQGGTQALSRSLFGSMIPKHRSAEFFGLFSTMSKFAGILGPLVFAVATQTLTDKRAPIVILGAFFVVGGALLAFVHVEEGVRAARQEEQDAVSEA